jgi:indolepyruvate ferredoxin oxidoreductase alpha subunit
LVELLSGNEAIARGAFEAGVTVATGYPGTPSTEILENLVAQKEHVYCEWCPNEKVALEVAAGASFAGARTIVTMKHVGLNVAADPLMTLAYVGAVGGLVICVGDDPGMHSSQNEQDTRHFARFAKIPIFEPADSSEARDFVRLALEVSEKYNTPTILRTTTRVSHSRSLVKLAARQETGRAIRFEKDPPRFVPIPLWARIMRTKVEERLGLLRIAASTSSANRLEWADRKLGIIACGIAYQYVREIFPEASVLKLGWCYPFPDDLLRQFAAGVEQVLVVEELDDFVEEHVKALGIACRGRDVVPGIGELSPSRLAETRAKMEGRTYSIPVPPPQAADLPARPPVLCPGCPHRSVFHALGQFDVIVTGDIGCYSLGVFKPLSRIDTILCMGGGVTLAHGMDKAGEKRKIVGIVGDSTFFHSGVTGLLNTVYNRGVSTIIVVDNRTTAMTGHQDHPGTGKTLMGQPAPAASIAEIGRACGIKRVRTIDPHDMAGVVAAIREELAAEEPSLIVSAAPCVLADKDARGPVRHVDDQICKKCGLCLKLGCPAMEGGKAKVPDIQDMLCAGCGMCEQVCKFDAISCVGVEEAL